MKRGVGINIAAAPRRSLSAILSDAGFEFREEIVQRTTGLNRLFKRSTSSVISTDPSALHQGYGTDYAIQFDHTKSNDYVTVDGRTAAVGEPLFQSSNSHKLHTFSQGQKLKHNPLRYGGTFYGLPSTTRSPFRYTSKYSTMEQASSTTENVPDSNHDTSTPKSLFSQDSSKNYAYLNDGENINPTTNIYQLYQSSHDEDEALDTTISEHFTPLKSSQSPLKMSTVTLPEKDFSATHPTKTIDSHSKSDNFKATNKLTKIKSSVTKVASNAAESTGSTSTLLAVPPTTISPSIDFSMSLNFKKTSCPKKDVVKLSCGDLQCGIRAKATINRAK